MIGPRPSRTVIPFLSSAGGGGGPVQVFLDTFTGSGPLSSHTPDVGSPWTITGDVPALTGAGALELNSSFAVTQISVTLNARFDATWEFTFDPLWGSNLNLRFNVLDNSNRWHVYWGTDGDTVNVYINDALEITWTATNRPLKDNTTIEMWSFVAEDQVLLDRIEVLA